MRKVDLAELFCQGLGLDTTSDGTQIRRGLQIGYSDETYAHAGCPSYVTTIHCITD